MPKYSDFSSSTHALFHKPDFRKESFSTHFEVRCPEIPVGRPYPAFRSLLVNVFPLANMLKLDSIAYSSPLKEKGNEDPVNEKNSPLPIPDSRGYTSGTMVLRVSVRGEGIIGRWRRPSWRPGRALAVSAITGLVTSLVIVRFGRRGE
jgi:hypothetical protein